MKKISLILVVAMMISLLAGCAGTTVVYHTDCTCPTGSHSAPATDPTNPSTPSVSAEGEIKTGLYIGVNVGKSVDGKAEYDVTLAAVTVDENGVILSCRLDSIGTSLSFEGGAISTDLTAPIQSKNELGDSYGMKVKSGIGAEWYQQAENFSAYVTGKTAADVAGIAIAETTKPAEGTDLAATVTISIIGFQNLIAKAAA